MDSGGEWRNAQEEMKDSKTLYLQRNMQKEIRIRIFNDLCHLA